MKNLKSVLMLILMSMCVWSCKDDSKDVAVQKVTVKPTTVTLEPNVTQTVVATVVPSDANQAVEWKSEDEAVATVSGGVITAVAVGTTKVIATSIADPSQSATVTVTVTPSTTAVSSIEVNATEVELIVGEERWVEATALPETALNKEVEWESSNTAIATVDDIGMIRGIAIGTATVTVTSKADETKFATVAVTVRPPVLHLLTPADGAEINAQGYVFPITFDWETVEGATNYSLIISNNPAFPTETSRALAEDIEGGSVELFNAKEFNDLLEANGVSPQATATFYLKVVADNGSESPASSVLITRDKRIVYYKADALRDKDMNPYVVQTEGEHAYGYSIDVLFPEPETYSKAVYRFDYKTDEFGFYTYWHNSWNEATVYAYVIPGIYALPPYNGDFSFQLPPASEWASFEIDIATAIGWDIGKDVNDYVDFQVGGGPIYIKNMAFILYE
jgi:hypothetical protein